MLNNYLFIYLFMYTLMLYNIDVYCGLLFNLLKVPKILEF